MKRLFAGLLAFALLFSLAGCAQKAEPAGGSAAPSPGVVGENMFAMTMELDRLYLLPYDGGGGVLLEDKTTTCFDRRGSVLYAAFDDGSVARFDLSSGERSEAVVPGGPVLHRICAFDGGFAARSYSMTDTFTYIYREADGSMTKESGLDKYTYFMAAGDKLLGMSYEESGDQLVVWDAKTLTEVWKEPLTGSCSLYGFGGEAYLYDQGRRLFRIDTKNRTLESMELALIDTDYTLAYCWGGRVLIEGNYYNNETCCIVSDRERQPVVHSDAGYLTVVDAVGEHVLLRDQEYYPSDKVESWYTKDTYFALDMSTGQLTKLDAQGTYASLFSAGDFPLMDSSTARKPVTAELYSFFCESTGYGGSVPLCSTTHNAWLNIADRKADIALLAAPTREEQDYLKERNVTVEMKLYGGDGLVFIGNKACGVDDLSLDDVRAIYRGEITNWAQLGGAAHPIRVLYRDDQSGSQRLFEKLLWSGQAVPDMEALGFERLDEMSTIVSECLYDPYSIGYSIMTYLRDVYGKEDLLCFSLEGQQATPENVRAELYPLSTRGYVVIRSDEPENSPARRLFDWFGSPLCDRILTDNGISPLHGE